ncbi:myoD family inhibitor isoform X5 [Sagmatias obliquidens]|uniref:myoD family inhibitor isoform X5 n=1 Tax=Sagmatias obliquidens TaxID=3371155 RepID=UPI000F440B1B|nr:myoD family inhibitor isoform X5 [Lagenorhynchus obliquidens]
MRPSSRTQTDPGWLPEFQAGPRTRLRGRGSRTPSSRPGGPPLPAEPPGLIAGTRPRVAKALGTTAVLASTAPRGPSSVTLSLLPGLEVVTGSAQPAESALEEGSLEEAAPLMPQSNGPGASQALDSTDLDIPTEAVTHCCVHCILSCLFCEFLTLCNIVLDCATCGSCSSEDSCLCCCCCGSGECADCDLPCDLDCGILDACCESADCLEICMECCGLCFSS